MNARDRLFFKNVELHKSVSYRIKEDKEKVARMRREYRDELMKKQEEKANQLKKYNSLFYRLISYISR